MSGQASLGRKDSGTEWIGQVPTSWDVKPLKHIADFVNGMAFKPSDWTETGTPIIRIENLNGGDQFNCFPGHANPRYHVGKGDLLFGWSGNRGTSFGPFVWPREGLHYLNQHIFKVNPSRCSPRWLYWCLKAVTNYVEQQAHGMIGMVHVTKGKLGASPVPVPPDDQQEAIADFLDRRVAMINALIAKQGELLSLLEQKRSVAAFFAITKGLRPGAPMRDSGIEWIGLVPAHWQVVRLRHVAKVQSGIALGRKTDEPTTQIPYLRVANVQDGRLDLAEVKTIAVTQSEARRFRLQAGDVLMNEGGDNDKLGRGAIWHGEIEPCIHQNHVFAVRPHGVEPEWLTAVTGCDYAKRFFETRAKQTTNLASISSSNLREVPIVMPPVHERREILRHLQQQVAALNLMRDKAEHAISLLREHRAALITAVVTGNLKAATTTPSKAAA